MKRFLVLLYGVVSYLIFLATFLYAIGFVGNIFVPRSLDGDRVLPVGQALLVDFLLLVVFALQHSGMARPAFKRWLTRYIHEGAERSTYVLASSVALAALFWLWQPLGGVIWQAESEFARAIAYTGLICGWLLVLAMTFAINHFDLFGLRQSWNAFRGYVSTPLRFVTPLPYRYVRHPLYVGWLLAFWCTPTMTWSHLAFAIGTTLYILSAIRLEENDLVAAHPEYAAYRRSVPMLLPRIFGRRRRAANAEDTGIGTAA